MVVVIGESLVDVIGSETSVGGGPLNTAVACSRMGTSTAFLGGVSGDAYGAEILDTLINDCILFDPALCAKKQPTAKAVAKIDDSGNASYEFSFKGSAALDVTAEQMLQSIREASDLSFVFTGSCALALEPLGSEIEKLVSELPEGVQLFIDANVRSALVEDAEKYKERLLLLAKRAQWFRMSEEDYFYLFGPVPKEAVLPFFENLIITRGENGSTLYTKDGRRYDCPAEPAAGEIADTIGCGDTFNGAFLSCIDSGRSDWENVLKFCSRAAMLNLLKKGCQPPYREEVQDCGA